MRYRGVLLISLGVVQYWVLSIPPLAILSWSVLVLGLWRFSAGWNGWPRRSQTVFLLGRGERWRASHSAYLHASRDPLLAWQRLPRHLPALALDQSLLMRHCLVVGAPGCGKTQWMMTWLRQLIQSGEAVVVLDPKSAPALADFVRGVAKNARQPFLMVDVHRPEESARHDPLRYCQSGIEIAERILALMPGEESVFQGFCRGVLVTLAEGLWRSGEQPSLASLFDHLSDAGERLATRRPVKDFIQTAGEAERIHWALVRLGQHDRVHYQKLTAQLLAVLSQLVTGAGGVLFQTEASSPNWDIRRAVEQGAAVYVGLAVMAQGALGRALARFIFAELAAFALTRLHQRAPKRLWLFVDEAGEVLSEAMVQLLNKGRESGIQLCMAVQTLADLDTQGPRISPIIQGNCGAWVLFRQLDAGTREVFSQRLGELPVIERSRGRGESQQSGLLRSVTTHSSSESEHARWMPRIPSAIFAQFRDRECVLQCPDGSLWRLMIPLATV